MRPHGFCERERAQSRAATARPQATRTGTTRARWAGARADAHASSEAAWRAATSGLLQLSYEPRFDAEQGEGVRPPVGVLLHVPDVAGERRVGVKLVTVSESGGGAWLVAEDEQLKNYVREEILRPSSTGEPVCWKKVSYYLEKRLADNPGAMSADARLRFDASASASASASGATTCATQAGASASASATAGGTSASVSAPVSTPASSASACTTQAGAPTSVASSERANAPRGA